jgi:Rhodopirellula transposase DDE domain
MRKDALAEGIRRRYESLSSLWNERQRRLWAASEARAIGYGGVSLVFRVTGISRPTIHAGLNELPTGTEGPRIRRAGAGRKPHAEVQPDLLAALDMLVEPASRGDPESPLRWTVKSTRRLAEELRGQGYRVSHQLVAELLREAGYSLQANRKTIAGSQHPDRNTQFEFIAAAVKRQQRRGQPVISVDTKKKELVGNYRNSGPDWRPKGCPTEVRVHDFQDKELGKAIPYGVYDLTANAGWVSIGIDHDTAAFATATIQRWWWFMGRPRYPRATELLITADGGGSNASRSRLWKVELQKLADSTGLTLRVCHFPPGTSKWNKIEHRLFSHISINWRGQPLTSLELIVRLIGATTTDAGLEVRAAIDRCEYPTGRKVSDEELAEVRCKPATFHGNWNYRIQPCGKL